MDLILVLGYQLNWARCTLRGATAEEKAAIENKEKMIKDHLWRELGVKVCSIVLVLLCSVKILGLILIL
jgi:hypothetical protein